ncbi:MAG: hypothetical protein WB390_14700 [Pseudolabrys sp.]
MATPARGWTQITIEHEGRVITGWYRKFGKELTVNTSHGSKTAPLAGLNPEYLAKLLLRELAREGRA